MVFHHLKAHQQNRIRTFLGQVDDKDLLYNVNQSKIAIGSGGFSGKGFLKGSQIRYGFVPEKHTDFIFCTIGEEWGFLGSASLILLYVLLIWRIIKDAEKSREAFTRIYGYCVACCIFMHLFINIGMTIGLMPVIGIPLPFVSYGGSSLWGFTALLFIFIDPQFGKHLGNLVGHKTRENGIAGILRSSGKHGCVHLFILNRKPLRQ